MANNKKKEEYKKVSVPDRLKTDEFRFIKLIGKTKNPQEHDFTKAAHFAYDDPSLLRHLAKGYNYGILGGQRGFVEIDADHEPLITELKNKLPKTLTIETPHGGFHKYLKTDDPHTSSALADTWEDKDGRRKNIGHLTSYGRQVVGPGCSIFDCPKCGAHGRDDIKGTGAKIECLKCGYKGWGEERGYTIEEDVPVAEISWADLSKIIGVYMVAKKRGGGNDKQEETKYTFANEKYQNIMDVIANPEDFEEDGDGRYRGFPIFSNHQKTGYFLVYAKTNTWYSHKDEKGGRIPHLIALQEKIINLGDDLKGEKWWAAIKIMEEKYGITIQRDEEPEKKKKKTKNEEHKEKVENATAEMLAILHDKYQFITTEDTKTIYYYKDGVYEEAERLIETEVERHLSIGNSRYFCNEIIAHLQREKYIDRDTLNTDKTRIPLKNGLFNLDTFELEPFDKNARFTFRFPIKYKKDAVSPNIEAWIKQIVNEDSVDLLQEFCGYGFVPDFPMHKTLWLHGTGRNGKGAFMRLYKKLIGDNGSSVPLEQMSAGYRFALIRLKDSFCNICSEPPSNDVFQTETFKKITGADEIEGEIKGVTNTVLFTSFARIFIMGNSYPQIEDNSSGFWNRMEIVKFPHSYTDKAIPSIERKKIIEDGGEEDALAGFFNWCITGLKRLKEHEYRITQSKSSNETRLEFEKVANSVKAFIAECVTTKQGERYPQPELWNKYLDYCEDLALESQHKGDLTKAVGELRGITLGTAKINKKAQRVWNGLVFTEYGESVEEPKEPLAEAQQNIETVDKVVEVYKPSYPDQLGKKEDNDNKNIDKDVIGGDGAHVNFANSVNHKNNVFNCVCGKLFDTLEVLHKHQAHCKAFQAKQDKEAKV